MPVSYATLASTSKGRLIREPESRNRTPYQRDRDRIIHCGAFRRLRNKTQVFVESEGDYFRTRLTHSLEVAQIARTIARVLQVDEDLAEALALAHDIGHPCFGHAGERALDEAMKSAGDGGFDHNEQTFRILTRLEKRYAAFDGLNLTWETLEGVVKHNGPVKEVLPSFHDFKWDLELNTHAGIEAQIAALSDDIAYNTHDFDDGFRAGFFRLEEMAGLPLFDRIVKESRARYPGIAEDRLVYEIVRQAIGLLIDDLLAETRRLLDEFRPEDAEAVRKAEKSLVAFSKPVSEALGVLRNFLMTRMYRHERVNQMNRWAHEIVKGLFMRYMESPQLMPAGWQQQTAAEPALRARLVGDYVAGMTDRFAEQEYRRLYEKAA